MAASLLASCSSGDSEKPAGGDSSPAKTSCVPKDCGFGNPKLAELAEKAGIKTLEKRPDGTVFVKERTSTGELASAFEDFLAFDNSAKTKNPLPGGTFSFSGKTYGFGTGFAITSETESPPVAMSASGAMSADYANAASYVRTCLPENPDKKDCLERKGLQLAVSKTFFTEFWEREKMDSVIEKLVADPSKIVPVSEYFQKKALSFVAEEAAPSGPPPNPP